MACVRLCTDEDGAETQVVIPTVAFRFFVDVLAELANGNAVSSLRDLYGFAL